MTRTKAGSGHTSPQGTFATVPDVRAQRSVFNRSCGVKTSFDAGFLIPIFVDEALPGDTMNLRMTAFARMATAIYPVMDNSFIEYFFFFVPNRLIWDNWQKMNGEQDDPGDSIDFTVPTMDAGASGHAELSLSDYFGIPTKVDITHNCLHHRAYNLIWNEWFRAQELQDSVVVDKGDAQSDPADYVLLKRGKRHDYFTSALPAPQRGGAVLLPLGTDAPVTISGSATQNPLFKINSQQVHLKATNAVEDVQWSSSPTSSDNIVGWGTVVGLDGTADLTAATGATINQIRESFQIQKLLERDARGGTRYTEIIRSHFGVISPDARLQRPEYLGGGRSVVTMNPVASTVSSTDPQASLAAYGTSVGQTRFLKSFTEHGVIIGLASVRADLTYQQGLDRMFSRSTRYDFFWPSLAHLGEQAILSKEIFADGSANDEDVFGYIPRYDEYRYKPSKVTGLMRSNATQSLDSWHLAQEFATRPVLNATFIEEDPPFDRVIATPAEPHFIFDAFFEFRHARPMPAFAVPGLVDHF